MSTDVPWCKQSIQSITHVIIEYGVTDIANHAFQGNKGLISVTIPDSVSEIGYNAFGGCTGLNSFYNLRLSPQDIGRLFGEKKVKILQSGYRKKYYYELTSNKEIAYVKRSENYIEIPKARWGMINLDEKESYQYYEERTQSVRSEAVLYVPASVLDIYKRACCWKDEFKEILPIPEEPTEDTPEQIDKKIKELQQQIDNLLLKQAIMRGLKGNPKHVADFMSLFNQRDGLKYLTHDFDENNEFDYESFLSQIKKVCTENLGQLEIPKTLIDLLNQFAFEDNPKWIAFDKQFNPKEITSGWSSSEWEDAKNNKLHPIKHPEFAEIIKDFKRTTRIESPNLETITNKIFADETFEIEKKGLSKADFYTHVGEFKSALETIFEEIQKRSDTDDKKKVSIEYQKETCDDYFIRKVIITHHNSFPTRDDEDSLVKEWLSLDKGNMGKIAGHLQGYCHWSVITRINDKPLKVNILREKETPVQEEPEASEVSGFAHVLTFYYQS